MAEAEVGFDMPAAPEPPDDRPAADPEPSNWEYVSDDPLIYTNVPVTPRRGDVVGPVAYFTSGADGPVSTWGAPADDGRWQPTTAPVTRLPDNHPDHTAAPGAARQVEEG